MTSSGIVNLTFPPFKTRVEMRVITIPEKMQKSLDFDGRRALTEFASARWPGVDSQAQGMTIRLLPKTFAVARATSYGVPDADGRRPPLNPTFEGYLDRSAEAKRKGRDASRALCICRFGKDAPDWQSPLWLEATSGRSPRLRSLSHHANCSGSRVRSERPGVGMK